MTATLIPLRRTAVRPQPAPPPPAPDSPAIAARRRFWPMAGVFALFALPLVLGWGLFALGWRPGGAPHGVLIQPPQPLPPALATNDANAPTAGRWQVLLVGKGPCGTDCQAARRSLTQLRATLGKNADRVALREVPSIPVTPPDPGAAGQPPAAYRFYLADPLGRLILAYPAAVPWGDLRQDLDRLLKYSWVG